MRPYFELTLAAFVLCIAMNWPAFAGYHRFENNVSPMPGSQQVFPEYQTITTPAAASATAVHAAVNNPSTTTSLVVSSGITNPDVPRNLTVTTGGTTGDCAAGNVVVTGTDALGRTVSENLAITNAQNGVTTGAKAFRTVTSISLPAEQSTHSCTFSVGTGSALGLNRCLAAAGDFGHATFGGVKETTAPTITANATAVSGNTATLNSAVDGAHTVRLLYYQNYRCLP
jgi:hypothetical protein